MASKKTTRYYIPHPDVKACNIAGDLEQVDLQMPTHGRKIALIIHGIMGHKDYLYQRRLAKLLQMDSFRFDFRGNHETPGKWSIANLGDDLVDIKVVVDFLTSRLGYTVDVVVAHSRGSLVAIRWVCTTVEGAKITAFVNVAGRYRMERLFRFNAIYQPEIDKKGYYEWKATVARKPYIGKIYSGDLEEFAAWDATLVWDRFPQHVHVLTIQGLADEIVPPYDGVIYARALSNRSPGTHVLHMIEGANHNFIGKSDEVNETILGWLWQVKEGTVKGGIWKTGVRGKL